MSADSFADVLIVIPCLNEAGGIAALLRQLRADTPGALIAVADGGSTDGTRAIVAALAAELDGVRLVDNPARLQSAGINRAVALLGQGRHWLVRVDAHAGYPPRYVAGLVAAAARTGATSVVVPMRTIGRAGFQIGVAAAQNSRLGTGGAAHRVGGAAGFVDHGHHALMRLDAFQAVGGYRDTMSHNEDAELDLRLTAAGGRIWLEPSLAIDYVPRGAPGALFRQYQGYGRGRAQTLLAHGGRPKARQLAPLAIVPAVAGLALAPHSIVPALPALGWAGLCLGWGAALAVRSGDPRAALAGPAAMIMHFAWSLGFWREAAARLPRPARPRIGRA